MLRESPAITTVPDLLAELTGIELDSRIASGAGHSSVGTLQLGREYHTTLFILQSLRTLWLRPSAS